MADYTILLIDYEPRSIAQLRTPLVGAGYRVEVARDGIAGARRFAELEPDLTLVEAMLPKKHGFDLCKELKATDHGRRSPVLIITAVYKGNKYRSQATRHYGCDAYLEKPISGEALVEVIRGFLEPERPAQETAAESAGPPEQRPAAPGFAAATEDDIGRHLDSVLPGEDPAAIDDDSIGPDQPADPPTGIVELRTATGRVGSPELATAPHPTAVLSIRGALAVADHRVPVRALAEPVAARSAREPGETAEPPRAATARRGRILVWIAFVALLTLGGVLAFLLR